MKEFFGLTCRYDDMSPVLIPAGYTRDYIDGKIEAGHQLKAVHAAFQVRQGYNAPVGERRAQRPPPPTKMEKGIQQCTPPSQETVILLAINLINFTTIEKSLRNDCKSSAGIFPRGVQT